MSSRMRVVLTGATGYVASQLLPDFRERYDLVLLDVRADRDGTPLDDVRIADLSNPELEVNRAFFRGADAVVHCAYTRSSVGTDSLHEGSQYHVERNNVDLCRNVFELARLEGVPRVVVASSNHAADWYEPLLHSGRMDVVGPETLPLAANFYGWAKACYEHLGFIYACGSLGVRLQVVMIRIGAPREIELRNFVGKDPARYRRDLGAWISERDLRQLFAKSIEIPQIENERGVPFQVFYGISDNVRAFWSIVNARAVIGYAPEDDSEREYADDIAAFLHGRNR